MADRRDSQGRLLSTGEDDGDTKARQARADADAVSGFTATKAGAGAGGGSGMPKQRPDEDAGAYGARLRDWREGERATETATGQKAALRSMRK